MKSAVQLSSLLVFLAVAAGLTACTSAYWNKVRATFSISMPLDPSDNFVETNSVPTN